MIVARSPFLKEKILWVTICRAVLTEWKNNYFFLRIARAEQNQQLEKLYGAVEFNDRPMLEVKLTTAEPEAFEMILNYIYTDKIDCKRNKETSIVCVIRWWFSF